MSADPQVDTPCASSGCLTDALYFDSNGRTLFGWLHRAADAAAINMGLVICKPFGYEAICSHRSVRIFAETAAAIGVHALRFDYVGTGDSSDIAPDADQVDAWSQDVVAAIGELRRLTHVQRVCVLGFRLGAHLATLAAVQCKTVDGLILIWPTVDGQRYLRQLRTTRLAAVISDGSAQFATGAAVASDVTSTGSMEVSGFPLSAATLERLAQTDLTKLSQAPATDILIIDDNNLPAAQTWPKLLSALGARAEYRILPGSVGMLMTDPQFATTPQSMVDVTRNWLLHLPIAPGLQHRDRSPRQLTPDTGLPMTELALPGDKATHLAPLTERPVLLSSKVTLFGIVTEPPKGEKRRRAVILLNVGAENHIGSNRMYVSLARLWARNGYTVLRLDLAGLGDSATRPQRPENEVFPAAALDDISAAIEYIRGHYGASEITLGGLCSGAYHSLRAAAAGLPVNRILIVNPMNFYWKEGMTAENLQESVDVARNLTFYRARLLSTALWRRILTGQFNVWRIARILIHRPLLTLQSRLRDLARSMHIHLPRDLGSELEELVARGVRIVFIFSRGEPGIDVLKIQAGSSVKRIAKDCLVHIIDSADHIFSQSATRVVLERILSEELLAGNSPASLSVLRQGTDERKGRGAQITS